MNKLSNFCMAPWTHTYMSPQGERRLCCTSREPSTNFKQYIDSTEALKGSSKEEVMNYLKNKQRIHLPSLEEHWNSEHMKSVRKRMLAGEALPECQVCNTGELNTDVYRDYFKHLFEHKYDEVLETTDSDGHTTMKPVSWDYRFSNLCNFKCRMCGPMLSSSWETEERKMGGDSVKDHQPWLKHRDEIKEFQNTVVEEEFSRAVEEHRIEEIYWVGGEPLMYEQHWRYMNRIVELGDGPRLYARYNTNLSRISDGTSHLWRDILSHVRDWQIGASIDGTGQTGEYIRTGLNYNNWLENFREGITYTTNPRQMRLDFTLTTPGLTEIKNMYDLSKEFDVTLLTKVCFAFTPEVIMCPRAVPRDILDEIIDDCLEYCKDYTQKQKPLIDVLENLKKTDTFIDTYDDITYNNGMVQGKKRLRILETRRQSNYNMEDCLREYPKLLQWWEGIPDAMDQKFN